MLNNSISWKVRGFIFVAQMNLLEATPPIDPLRLYTLKVERLKMIVSKIGSSPFPGLIFMFSTPGEYIFWSCYLLWTSLLWIWDLYMLNFQKNHFHFWIEVGPRVVTDWERLAVKLLAYTPWRTGKHVWKAGKAPFIKSCNSNGLKPPPSLL